MVSPGLIFGGAVEKRGGGWSQRYMCEYIIKNTYLFRVSNYDSGSVLHNLYRHRKVK